MTTASGRPLPPASDLLLERDRDAILADLLASRTAWTPDWLPAPFGPGYGLAQIAASELELLEERLKRVPDHRLAALLDMLGASRLPAQGARAHVVLTAPPGTRGVRVPRGTRIGAKAPGRDAPVVFETQHDVAISSAAIVEVHSVVPAADAEQDHSADVLGGRPFTLFGDVEPVSRELFIGHDRLLAFDGRAVVDLQVGIAVPAPEPLRIEWAWWDGVQWRPFTTLVASELVAGDDDSYDGTAGLTASGTVRLVAPVATSVPQTLDGRETHWIRGRLTRPFTLAPGAPLPTIARLRLAVVNEHRRLRVLPAAGPAGVALHWPDAPAGLATVVHVIDATDGTGDPVYSPGNAGVNPPVPGALAGAGTPPVPADGHRVRLGVSLAASRLDTTTDLSRATPRRVALASDDDLTRPRLVQAGTTLELSVSRGLPLDKGIADRRSVDLTKTFTPLGPSPERGTAFLFSCETATARPGSRVTLLIERPETEAERSDRNADLMRDAAATTIAERDAIVALLDTGAVPELEAALAGIDALKAYLPSLLGPELRDAQGNALRTAAQWFTDFLVPVRMGIVGALANVTHANTKADDAPGEAAAAFLLTASVGSAFVLGEAIAIINTDLDAALAALTGLADKLPGTVPNGLLALEPLAFIQAIGGSLDVIRAHVAAAEAKVKEASERLKNLNPTTLAVQLAQPETTKLAPPRVEWEYYDGARWRALGVTGDERVVSLLDSGALHFTVPEDISRVDVDGDVRTWLRARLAEGTYARMTLVSWVDMAGDDRPTNFLPVVEPRPPFVDRIEVFYRHESVPVDPGAVKAKDVHRWSDLTADVSWPSAGGTPFTPMDETSPTVYLGLDAELPADSVGLWWQPAEASPWATAHRPLWEAWDGRGWARLAVHDGTDGMRREGVIRFAWPGTDAARGAAVTGAVGTAIELTGRGAALRYAVGEHLMLTDSQGQVPVVVAAADGEVVTVRDVLPRAFAGARLTESPPLRFGVPRTWIRASFDPLQAAPALDLSALAAHAVEVEQSETQRGDVLGSGDGSASQVLVARRYPLAGDPQVEVRELDGDRADLDRDVLERTLVADRIDPATVHTDVDPRSGRVTAVWVPWRAVSSLGATGGSDRVFVVDRVQGHFAFGDGVHGRALPTGRDNVRLRSYATTEGEVGNVGEGALSSLLSAVPVSESRNPLAASGGAGVETLESALTRAPALLRHRRLALTEADVEAIASEASPAVVRARALGAKDRWGRPAPGSVRVVVVARDGTDRPVPTSAVLGLVHDAVVAASPAVARVTIEGPRYRPVGVSVIVIPLGAAVAGDVREAVVRRLETFLHPLAGGPDGAGWDFGDGVHVSDVARVLEQVPGVDAVTRLLLTVDDAPVGGTAAVDPDELVCAGPLIVRLTGGE